jgi:glycosyltransferase involved in cell wall biosynthesis
MRIAVNGRFLAVVPTGVQRFALGVARELLPASDAILMLPRDAQVPGELVGARTLHGRLRGHAWEQLELPRMTSRAGCDVTLNLANSLPIRGGPHAVMIHDATVFQNPEWFGLRYRLWHRRVQLPAAKRSGAIGTLSRDAAERLAEVLGRPADSIEVVPQGAAPLDAPAAGDAVARVRERLGIGGPYLLAVGGSDPRKNVGFLENVLARWSSDRAGPTPTLVVVGEASSRIFARPAAHGAHAEPDASRVHVLRPGRVDDETLRALYTGAAAFCFPSLAEGFGRPPLEALACGAPVVTAPYGPAREVLGDAARIIPLEEGPWLAELERLVQHGPDAATAPAAAAVLARHTWAESARVATQLCERACSASRSRAPRDVPECVAR